MIYRLNINNNDYSAIPLNNDMVAKAIEAARKIISALGLTNKDVDIQPVNTWFANAYIDDYASYNTIIFYGNLTIPNASTPQAAVQARQITTDYSNISAGNINYFGSFGAHSAVNSYEFPYRFNNVDTVIIVANENIMSGFFLKIKS